MESKYKATTNGQVEVEVRRGSSGVGVHSLKWTFLKLTTSVTYGVKTLMKVRWSRTRPEVPLVTESGVLKISHPFVVEVNASFSLCAHVVIVGSFESHWAWFYVFAWGKKGGTSKRKRRRSSGMLWATVRQLVWVFITSLAARSMSHACLAFG